MKKTIISLFLPAITMIFCLGCTTIKYVPVKETEYVAVHDTTYFHRTDTLVQIPEVKLGDFIDLTDTLRLSTDFSIMSAWVDTTHNVLAGRLEQGGKLPVQVVEKERIVRKDSLIYQQVPYPVIEEKIVKVVPLFWRIMSVIGILAIAVVAFWFWRKFI